MYPVTNKQYERTPISGNYRESQALGDTHDDEDALHQSFQPRTLRLSSSFPSFGNAGRPSYFCSAQQWKAGLVKARSTSLSISQEDEQSSSSDVPTQPSQEVKIPEVLLRTARPPGPRLRTRSVDRKPKGFINSTPKPTSYIFRPNVSSAQREPSLGHGKLSYHLLSSSPPSEFVTRHPVGFHTHIPIEHTVLSVLPGSRKSSIDSTASAARFPDSTDNVSQDSPSVSSSGDPKSTLATSVDSSDTPSRPRYQPKPLLLSTFGMNKQTSNLVSSTGPKVNSKSSSGQELTYEVLNNRRQAATRLEKAQQLRQQRIHAREAKQMRKRTKEAELSAISNSANELKGSLPLVEAREDDRWSWLSASDVDDQSEDEEVEEIAVVWRASLDVGRRVPKDRVALGKGHGIRLPPRNLSRPSVANPTFTSSTRSVSHSQSASQWLPQGWRHLSPRCLFNSLIRLRVSSMMTPFKVPCSGFFIFGSGLMSGVIGSILCATLSGQFPSFAHRRLLPTSSYGIGLFFNLIFPQSAVGLYSTSIGYLSPGCMSASVGLCTQW